jgi:hypothetical protein
VEVSLLGRKAYTQEELDHAKAAEIEAKFL